MTHNVPQTLLTALFLFNIFIIKRMKILKALIWKFGNAAKLSSERVLQTEMLQISAITKKIKVFKN